jgi:hypothetical protein
VTEIQVGQIWADNDPRSAGRTLQVEVIDERYVRMRVLTDGKATVRSSVGRLYAISKDRLRPTKNGYILVR